MAKKTGSDKYFEGIGRRKTAVARVRFLPASKELFYRVNGKDYQLYFDVKRLSQLVVAPLKVLDGTARKESAVEVKVRGGGITAQSEAVVLGLARALTKFNEDFKKELRVMGYLTRDSRRVERKKFGLKKARRAPQWRKR
ncbi:MAG: 30S ribosomal protein S9 [Candidatus Colwellbacteria bacterium]|nr:30S ribosomal protein S9 [Candidatus Colwellbacteria bacterium]